MKSTLRVIAFTLLFPVLAFGAAVGTLAKLDDSVRDQVRRQYPNFTEKQIDKISVPYLEAQHAFSSPALPQLYFRLEFVRTASAVTAALGILLIASIAAAGYASRRRRDLLLRFFSPGLYLTLIGAALLTFAQTIELAYAGYYYESATVGAVHLQFLIVLGIGGVFALVAVTQTILSMFKTAELRILGMVAIPSEQPRLWNEVKELCGFLEAPPPEHIVLGLEPTFFVTESDLTCSGAKLSGRTLFLSLTLSRLLTREELKAVLGHELAHFLGEDTAYTKRFFPVYRGTLTALARLSNRRGNFSAGLARLPAVAFVGFFYQSFARGEKEVSRSREHTADRVGARVAGAPALGGALVKLHAHVPIWKKVYDGFRYHEQAFQAEGNAAKAFIDKAQAQPAEELQRVGTRQIPHPFDSHPTLAERLSALEVQLPDLAVSAAVPPAELSGWSLIQGAEALEEAQTAEIRRLKR
jgi:Zn-dependent protease with chaperone function